MGDLAIEHGTYPDLEDEAAFVLSGVPCIGPPAGRGRLVQVGHGVVGEPDGDRMQLRCDLRADGARGAPDDFDVRTGSPASHRPAQPLGGRH